MIHLETTLNDSIRMELPGVLRGEAERSVSSSEETIYFMLPLSNA